MTFKLLSNPIMFVSDNPALLGGLSRLCRDVTTLTCTLPQFRVGVLGRGLGNRRKLPFTLYDFDESGGWGQNYIQQAWEDFSSGEPGIIFSLDDPSRRHWMVNPVGLPPRLQEFLNEPTFKRWGHFPIDSTGPNGSTLSWAGRDCVNRFDRVLSTSEWGCNVLKRGGMASADWLPHGILEVFKPIPKAKELVGWEDNVVAGCIMTNQSRKDWPAAFECFQALRKHYGSRFLAWVHVDRMVNYWDIAHLAIDYEVGDCLEVTLALNDDQLALRYSGCDCTILPSAGEGFGYPIAESLACGTACIVTDYAAGQEIVPEDCRVRPVTYRVDTAYNVLRAVLSGHAFAAKVIPQVDKKQQDPEYRSGELQATVEHLQWNNLRHSWERWLLDGLK